MSRSSKRDEAGGLSSEASLLVLLVLVAEAESKGVTERRLFSERVMG